MGYLLVELDYQPFAEAADKLFQNNTNLRNKINRGLYLTF